MNVIITNRYEDMISNLPIDVIKKVNGQFEVEEIVTMFSNFFYQRMILDITAIKDYTNINVLQKLSIAFDMDKVILLLEENDESSDNNYLSKLISMGIYNFTRNQEGIMYLYNNPNSYRDVAHLQHFNTSNGVSEEGEIITSPNKARIIGFKNVTPHSGVTTLVYMLKKQLEKNYSVLAIQEGSTDFAYFDDTTLKSVPNGKLATHLLRLDDVDVVLVDLGDRSDGKECDEVIKIIEPSILKLNKMVKRNRTIFSKLKNSKVVLNQSLLSQKDVLDLEYEGKFKTFISLPPLDERFSNHQVLDIFLTKLGFDRQEIEENEEKSSIWGLFK